MYDCGDNVKEEGGGAGFFSRTFTFSDGAQKISLNSNLINLLKINARLDPLISVG